MGAPRDAGELVAVGEVEALVVLDDPVPQQEGRDRDFGHAERAVHEALFAPRLPEEAIQPAERVQRCVDPLLPLGRRPRSHQQVEGGNESGVDEAHERALPRPRRGVVAERKRIGRDLNQMNQKWFRRTKPDRTTAIVCLAHG